jgi:hypothetical protein
MFLRANRVILTPSIIRPLLGGPKRSHFGPFGPFGLSLNGLDRPSDDMGSGMGTKIWDLRIWGSQDLRGRRISGSGDLMTSGTPGYHDGGDEQHHCLSSLAPLYPWCGRKEGDGVLSTNGGCIIIIHYVLMDVSPLPLTSIYPIWIATMRRSL